MERNRKIRLSALFRAFVFCLFGLALTGGAHVNASGTNTVADIALFPDGIEWTPKVEYSSMVLRVSCPDGAVLEKTFMAGVYPFLDFSRDSDIQITDGGYNYELQAVPKIDPDTRASLVQARADGNTSLVESLKQESGLPVKPLVQSGNFLVQNGLIVTGDGDESGGDTKSDVLHYDDVIITGSQCIGFDCQDGESFGFDTIILKEHNLRIYFNDTSYTASYPTNNWRITVNDSTNGGASYFSIDDVDDGASIFKIEAGAPSNSLYVEDYGRVGLGTSTPVVELHIKDSDTPTLRLEQDSSGGWTPQTFDVAGNESNFFIRDATHGSKLPFRIQPDTPSSTLCLKSDGRVGIGTWSPAYPLELETTGENAMLYLDRTDGAQFKLNVTTNKGQIGTHSSHKLVFTTCNTGRMTIDTNGYVGISTNTPAYPLDMGTLANGAYCTTGGVWHDASSREYKENIEAITGEEASLVVAQLNPVKYNYKVDKDEKHVGFIAEDVPDLVASKDRKAMSSMDIVAVLTKVVQEQQKLVDKQQKMLLELSGRVQDLENQLKLKQNMNLAGIESQ
ncbi:MAG TPA: tail fiber domain-containing protein [Desulfobacteraceae bacterium]|nr:tail fiber domain-containing protein [Desulfobacteraceae bacterium]